MTIPDLTAEIKAIRHQLGARFDYDLKPNFADIQSRQNESDHKYITLPPRRIADHNPTHERGEAERTDVENLSSPPGDR